jgi:two-component system, NtrC family, sensor kinase
MSARVIIVDDSLTVRMDLGEAFEEAGFEVALCAGAQQARAEVAQGRVSALILDVVLPDGDGVELLAEFRQAPTTAHVPIVMLSAEAEVKDRVRGLRTGADDFIGKPYEAAYLVARVADLIREASDTAPPTVLVIDDSQTYRNELGERLRDAGYNPVLAASGEQGLQFAVQIRPDAIVVDGVMPGLDGAATIGRVRLDPGLHSTPCLLLTATEAAAGEVLALDAGADAFVRKAEGAEVVLARLGAMLRAAQASRGRTRTPTPSASQTILAVDDSPTYLEALTGQLQADGYGVVTALSGEEALERLNAQSVDCVLLDLLMPGLSGTETCKRIKGSSVLRNLPLILLTALDSQDAMIEGINAGADDYVTKSADFDVLKARLRSQLRRKQFEEEYRRVREEVVQKDAEARAARELAEARSALLRRLEEKNSELQALNFELQSFANSVSHDLRQPLRSIDGFSSALLDEYTECLDETGIRYLTRVRAGVQRMSQLIDGLLSLCRIGRRALDRQPLRLDTMARTVLDRLRDAEPGRNVECVIAEPMPAFGDSQLVESVLENLLGNAWKFTGLRGQARIEVGMERRDAESIYFVKDDGAGFDMRYVKKLFGPFQRLHSESEFPGTGIGLATVHRIVHRHGGEIWAESAVDHGAKFSFTLGFGGRPDSTSAVSSDISDRISISEG